MQTLVDRWSPLKPNWREHSRVNEFNSACIILLSQIKKKFGIEKWKNAKTMKEKTERYWVWSVKSMNTKKDDVKMCENWDRV